MIKRGYTDMLTFDASTIEAFAETATGSGSACTMVHLTGDHGRSSYQWCLSKQSAAYTPCTVALSPGIPS